MRIITLFHLVAVHSELVQLLRDSNPQRTLFGIPCELYSPSRSLERDSGRLLRLMPSTCGVQPYPSRELPGGA